MTRRRASTSWLSAVLLGALGCGALTDRGSNASGEASGEAPSEAGTESPSDVGGEAPPTFALTGAGPEGCVEQGETLWRPELVSAAQGVPIGPEVSLLLDAPQLYVAESEVLGTQSRLFVADTSRQPLEVRRADWNAEGVTRIEGTLVREGSLPDSLREERLDGEPVRPSLSSAWRGSASTEEGIYWATGGELREGASSEGELWFQALGASEGELVGALPFAPSGVAIRQGLLWVAGASSGGGSAAALELNAPVSLAMYDIPERGFMGFGPSGPTFGMRDFPRQGGTAHRYPVWEQSAELARLWSPPAGQVPQEVWSQGGAAYARVTWHAPRGQLRDTIVHIAGGSARRLVCLPEGRSLAGPTPIVLEHSIVAFEGQSVGQGSVRLVEYSLD